MYCLIWLLANVEALASGKAKGEDFLGKVIIL